jgi:hypothetical protein
MIIFVTFIFINIVVMQVGGRAPNGVSASVLILILGHIGTMFIVTGPLWAAVLFLGNITAMPVYWYLYVRREPRLNPPLPLRTGRDAV